MSHYAKTVGGIVTQVITAEADFFNTFVDTSPGTWIQTSYNTKGGIHYGQDGKPDGGIALRANFAGVGYIYNQENDVFHSPRPIDMNGMPCASWTISAPTWIWMPPISCPTDGKVYDWNESTKSWVSLTNT